MSTDPADTESIPSRALGLMTGPLALLVIGFSFLPWWGISADIGTSGPVTVTGIGRMTGDPSFASLSSEAGQPGVATAVAGILILAIAVMWTRGRFGCVRSRLVACALATSAAALAGLVPVWQAYVAENVLDAIGLASLLRLRSHYGDVLFTSYGAVVTGIAAVVIATLTAVSAARAHATWRVPIAVAFGLAVGTDLAFAIHAGIPLRPS
ncbi:hypothetical protein [Mycobacteroides salmoniphilum]|uniref:hypothetical protein n=1 Tax=Mycobacteroides salmoniphilum TaxID=404941 RepID=UPI0010AAA657|nr:hypothetical protein [Mycobacteroides salmoniphilum]QCH25108.1 hypothetical protein DSM43276_03382 [Mycobacteroides salmoniphilum]